jgi:hypothetical protein
MVGAGFRAATAEMTRSNEFGAPLLARRYPEFRRRGASALCAGWRRAERSLVDGRATKRRPRCELDNRWRRAKRHPRLLRADRRRRARWRAEGFPGRDFYAGRRTERRPDRRRRAEGYSYRDLYAGRRTERRRAKRRGRIFDAAHAVAPNHRGSLKFSHGLIVVKRRRHAFSACLPDLPRDSRPAAAR